MASLEIVDIRKLEKDLIKDVINKMNPLIQKDFAVEFQPFVKDRFLKSFERNDVVLGLSGFYEGEGEEKDLQAVFGLDDATAKNALSEMYRVVQDTINITFELFTLGSDKIGYRLTFYYDNLEHALRGIEDAEYPYEYQVVTFSGNKQNARRTTTLTIPWLQWLLDGAQTQASIEFDLDQQAYDGHSRSGRAIMHRTGEGWTWFGKNFIEDIANSQKFIDDIEDIMAEKLSKKIASL